MTDDEAYYASLPKLDFRKLAPGDIVMAGEKTSRQLGLSPYSRHRVQRDNDRGELFVTGPAGTCYLFEDMEEAFRLVTPMEDRPELLKDRVEDGEDDGSLLVAYVVLASAIMLGVVLGAMIF